MAAPDYRRLLGHRRSHKNPGQEGGRATAREAHCPSAEAQTSDHTNDIASRRSVAAVVVVGESAWPATTTIGSSFCQASYIVRRRPRSLGIPGSPSSIPTRARLQEALQICWRETSFHRFTKEQNSICRTCTLGNWHCTDRQILPWRQSGGTETLCGSPALPPSFLPPTYRAGAGGMGVGVSVKMSGEISIAGKENEEARQREEGQGADGVDFEFYCLLLSVSSAASINSAYKTSLSAFALARPRVLYVPFSEREFPRCRRQRGRATQP